VVVRRPAYTRGFAEKTAAADRSVPWDPTQYLKFGDHRLRPALDLLARIEATEPAGVYDLGAGTGNVTRLLRERWPSAHVTGVDDSPEMLASARAAEPMISWQLADLATWAPSRPADVIYSNAALHWVDGHGRLFPALLDGLAPGGILAVQMPHNFSAPSHTLIADAARGGPWRAKLEPLLRPAPVSDPSFYHDVLAPRASSLDIWETEYLHVLAGDDPVKEWVKGTWLRPLLDGLDEAERPEFEKHYAELLRGRYPRRADGRTLFPFRRLFLVATARF
jgi:trans-aconitate 2-methyltransferase